MDILYLYIVSGILVGIFLASLFYVFVIKKEKGKKKGKKEKAEEDEEEEVGIGGLFGN